LKKTARPTCVAICVDSSAERCNHIPGTQAVWSEATGLRKKQLARLARRAALIQALKDATTFMTFKRFGAKRQKY
jgi:hypothetical protein